MSVETEINSILLQQVYGLYADAEKRMLEKVAKRVKRGVTEVGWTEDKLKDVQRLRREISTLIRDTNSIAKKTVSKGVLDAYLKGVNSANKDMHLATTALKELDIPEHLQRLILETNNLIDGTSVQILRNTMDTYRSVIAETTTGILAGTDTPLQMAQTALNKFAAAGITGFVDKAGRNWELASYVEMATRTTAAHAALQGHIDRQLAIGNDLVVVSSIGTTCPICAPWQNAILSITGKTKGYSTLEDAKQYGLFHPNCKHTITAYFPDMDEHEHEHDEQPKNNEWLYKKTQEQRYNERQIRRWKRVEAVALEPAAQVKAANKIKYWQAKQRELIANTGLRRNYGRESIAHRIGYASKVPSKVKIRPPKEPLPKKEPVPRLPDYKRIPTLANLEKRQQEIIKSNGLDPNQFDFIGKAAENMKKMVDNSELRMRVPGIETLSKILNSKFKNQMEIGTSRGMYDPSYRKQASNKLFGTDLNIAKDSDYEIYGYLGNKNIMEDLATDHPSQYGNIIVQFKRENLFHRTTFTIDDSLGPGSYDEMAGSKLNEIVPVNGRKSDVAKIANMQAPINPNTIIDETGVSYIEAQYHGGVTVNDIESITIDLSKDYKVSDADLKLINSKGIKLQYVESSGGWSNRSYKFVE
jgi:hypothetical protein